MCESVFFLSARHALWAYRCHLTESVYTSLKYFSEQKKTHSYRSFVKSMIDHLGGTPASIKIKNFAEYLLLFSLTFFASFFCYIPCSVVILNLR